MTESTEHCLNCGRPSAQVPLIRLTYAAREHWICAQCFPLLIHKPERLAAVAGAWTANQSEHHPHDE